MREVQKHCSCMERQLRLRVLDPGLRTSADGETSPLCGLSGGPPYRCGGLGVPPIIITLARLFRALEAFLHGSLAKRFVVLQIDDGLISDIGEIAIRARERLDAGF